MSRTAHPTASVEAFVSSAPCGHRHGVRSYADGCSYATQMTWAIDAANEGDHDRARLYVLAADRALMPLCNINNPESLRDFIAGVNAGLEAHLRTLGSAVAV